MSKTDDTDKCPFEHILKFDSNSSKYLVKFINKKYADSEYLTEEEICKYPEGKTMFNRFLRHKAERTDSRPYDPQYDRIDTILFQKDDKYLILWCGLGFDDLTWETDIKDKKQMSLFTKRLSRAFPQKNEDVHFAPKVKLEFVDSFGALTPTEILTLNQMIDSYNKQRDFLHKENMGINSINACVSFLRILQTQGEEYGPYLIVSDSKKWYDKLRERSEIFPIYYNGNEPSCEKIRELFFNFDQINFHALVITPEKLAHDIQYISQLNYRLAIFHSSNAQQIYKSYPLLDIGINICINVMDAFQSAQELERLSSSFLTAENSKLLTNEEIRKSQEINKGIQPLLLKKQKHSDPQFVSPPVISIDCPLSEIQKKMCRSVLTKYAKSTQTAAEKVLRICSHAFLIENGEYDLGSPDLIQSSTKLQVLYEILDYCKKEVKVCLVISQNQQMINYIIDVLDIRGDMYVEVTSEFDEQAKTDIPAIYLHNPKNAYAIPPIENIQCVVIFDGSMSIWTEIVFKYRATSRTLVFNISNIFLLETRDCCENELQRFSEYPLSFNQKRAEVILNAASIHAFSEFELPTPQDMINRGIVYNADRVLPLSKYMHDCNLAPFLKGEVIEGKPPDEFNDADGEHEWTIHERNSLARGIIQIGFTRWEAIQRIVGLYLPVHEIESKAVTLIAILLKATNSNGYTVIRQFLKREEEERNIHFVPFSPDSIFMEEPFISDLRFKASAILKRIEYLSFLDVPFGGGTDITPEQVPYFRFNGSRPTEWWTETHDRALAYLTRKFGLGVFDHITEYQKNIFCEAVAHLPEAMEYKRLTERALKMCEISKRVSMTDQKVIENLSNRPSKLTQEAQKTILSYILSHGLIEEDDQNDERDFDMLADQIQVSGIEGKDIKEYYENLLKQAESDENYMFRNMVKSVKDRVDVMSLLRKLISNKKVFREKISAARRQSLPKKWSVDIEMRYLEEIERRGFGNIQAIFESPEFSSIFEKSNIPTLLLIEEEIGKRIRSISEYGQVQSSSSKKSSRSSGSSSSSTFSSSSSRSKSHSSSSRSSASNASASSIDTASLPLEADAKPPIATNSRATSSSSRSSRSSSSRSRSPASSRSASSSSRSAGASSSSSKKRKRATVVRPAVSPKMIVLRNLKELQRGVKYPFTVNQFSKILDIGHIVSDRAGFHCERYIYPAGFKSTKIFNDLRCIEDRITWINEIVDDGSDAPIFRIYPEDDPEYHIDGITPSQPWVAALKKLSQLRGEKNKANTISGPDAFLLSHNMAIYLIQHLPGAKDCIKYQMRPIQGESNPDDDDDDADDNDDEDTNEMYTEENTEENADDNDENNNAIPTNDGNESTADNDNNGNAPTNDEDNEDGNNDDKDESNDDNEDNYATTNDDEDDENDD